MKNEVKNEVYRVGLGEMIVKLIREATVMNEKIETLIDRTDLTPTEKEELNRLINESRALTGVIGSYVIDKIKEVPF